MVAHPRALQPHWWSSEPDSDPWRIFSVPTHTSCDSEHIVRTCHEEYNTAKLPLLTPKSKTWVRMYSAALHQLGMADADFYEIAFVLGGRTCTCVQSTDGTCPARHRPNLYLIRPTNN